jgi:predicted nucleotidyltransferase
MNGDDLLTVGSDRRDELLSQFDLDILVIGDTQVDVLNGVDLGGHKEAYLQNVLLLGADVANLELVVLQKDRL